MKFFRLSECRGELTVVELTLAEYLETVDNFEYLGEQTMPVPEWGVMEFHTDEDESLLIQTDDSWTVDKLVENWYEGVELWVPVD